MKSNILVKNILVTIVGLCIFAIIGFTLMIASSEGDIFRPIVNSPSSSSSQITVKNEPPPETNTATTYENNGESNALSSLPPISDSQKKQVLAQFFDAADHDIATLENDIKNAKNLGESNEKINEKEIRLSQMEDIRQKMMTQNIKYLF
ncbi:hypothetical protein [Acinetobacter sp. WZC-1]|uniref:hypothetical protein n=1 Tax=Acinetobacter sp. WZC-1 TaxID=3459034 RepID=UPI00403E1F15